MAFAMLIYELAVPQSRKMLASLDRWIEKGVAFAEKKSFDPEVLLGARLAPDQYPLVRQIQSACFTATFTVVRLAGKEAAQSPNTEQTVGEIRERIRATSAFLESCTPADFVGAETRPVELPILPGQVILGQDYLREWAMPHFYFHVTTAYAILRHNGVDLGKSDYLGALTTHPR